jgi:hypothetical protein
MKDRLFLAALAGVGFLATLGIGAMHGELWPPPAAPVQRPAARRPVPPATVSLQAMAARAVTPAASEPQPSDGERADSGPAPTYEEQSAARDRAAAHSARSR